MKTVSVSMNNSSVYIHYISNQLQEQKLKNTFEDTIPRALKMIENFLKKSNNGESFLVGDSVSLIF